MSEVIYVYYVKEGRLKKALKLVYKYASELGEKHVILLHPRISLEFRTDRLEWLNEVAVFSHVKISVPQRGEGG